MKKKTKKIAVEAGLAAATLAAAAGAYFLYGTKGGKRVRKKIASWSLKAKGEVLEKLEQAKTVSEASYKKAVSEVMAKYKKLKKEHGPEVAAVARELHSYWNHLKKHLK